MKVKIRVFHTLKKRKRLKDKLNAGGKMKNVSFFFLREGFQGLLDFVDVFSGCFLTFISICFLSIPLYNMCPCSIELSL